MSDQTADFAPPPPPPGTPPPSYAPTPQPFPGFRPAPPGAPPPPFQSPGFQPPAGYAPAPGYQPYAPQPYTAAALGAGAAGLGLMYQFTGVALVSIACGAVAIIVPLVTNFYFPVLPIIGALNGFRAFSRGRVIGGLVGIGLNIVAGFISLVASGLLFGGQ